MTVSQTERVEHSCAPAEADPASRHSPRAHHGSNSASTSGSTSAPASAPTSARRGLAQLRTPGQLDGVAAETRLNSVSPHQAASTLQPTQKPWLTRLTLVSSDLLALALANFVAVTLRHSLGGAFDPSVYWRLWPILGVFIAGFAISRLYRFPLPAPEEISRVVTATSVVYLGLGAVTFLSAQSASYSRGIYVMGLLGSIVAVLTGRTLTKVLARRAWWGTPAVIVGCGRRGRGVIRFLLSQPELGITPVGIVDDRPWRRCGFKNVPVLGPTSDILSLAKQHRQLRFIVLCPELSPQRIEQLFAHEQHHLPNLLLIPHLTSPRSVGVQAHDLNGTLGLEVRHRLPQSVQRVVKWWFDLILIAVFAPMLVPVAAAVAAAIKLESSGPVFFTHERIGLDGKPFMIWKFRTMVDQADQALDQHLAANPRARSEWAANQKLRCDPRVTRVGSWLRQTSLDELPQVINVVRGTMSLVGPRPIIESERWRYGDFLPQYTRLRPGITGMWQVSGRNDLSYDDRVQLDAYYARNWSVWLDLSILTRTVFTVCLRQGAY